MNRHIETLGYLGPEASFTYEAALDLQANHPKYKGVTLIWAPSIALVSQLLVDSKVDQVVLPVENSTDGPVNDTLAALRKYPFHIRLERSYPIRQSAFHRIDSDPAAIKWLISKDSALGQVKHTASKLYPNAMPEARPSTIDAVLDAAKDPEKAAIGPRLSAKAHGLSDVLVQIDDVHDNPLNTTRFIILDTKDEETPPTGSDKTSLIAQMPDQPGSLYQVLDTFVDQGINLAKIKSFGRDDGAVAFLMDLEGHQQDLPLSSALQRLGRQGVRVKMLGSYPRDTYQLPEIPWEINMEDSIEQLRGEVVNGINHQEKTVVAFTLRDRVGALRDALRPFSNRGINLTEIDSLPTGRLGEYIFYLAFENGINQRVQALNELKEQCTRLAFII